MGVNRSREGSGQRPVSAHCMDRNSKISNMGGGEARGPFSQNADNVAIYTVFPIAG